MDDPIQLDSPGSSRILLIALLGVVGCAIVIVANTPPKPITTTQTVGTFVGLYLAFIGLAGVVDAVRGGR